MGVRILVDSSIVVAGTGITSGGHTIDRFDDGLVQDLELLRLAVEERYDVLVVAGDAFEATDIASADEAAGIALAVCHERHPIRAGERINERADELASQPPGSRVEVLADGLRPFDPQDPRT